MNMKDQVDELSAQLAQERADRAQENADRDARLAKLEALLDKAIAPAPVATAPVVTVDAGVFAREMAAAMRDLQESRPQMLAPPDMPPGPVPTRLVPYKGLVRALRDCEYGGQIRGGPGSTNAAIGLDRVTRLGGDQSVRPDGEVFEVDLPQLWSDDPFIPVTARKLEDGRTVYHPHLTAHVLDARWRGRLAPAQLVGDMAASLI